MTGRLQILRSNVSGTRPTVASRRLYVNWADGQIGSVNSVGGAQDLAAFVSLAPSPLMWQATSLYKGGNFTVLSHLLVVVRLFLQIGHNWAARSQ